MLFTNSDRALLREIAQSVGQINDRLDIHKQLVEINANLKAIRDELGGMTPAEEEAAVAKLNAVSDKLDGIANSPT